MCGEGGARKSHWVRVMVLNATFSNFQLYRCGKSPGFSKPLEYLIYNNIQGCVCFNQNLEHVFDPFYVMHHVY